MRRAGEGPGTGSLHCGRCAGRLRSAVLERAVGNLSRLDEPRVLGSWGSAAGLAPGYHGEKGSLALAAWAAGSWLVARALPCGLGFAAEPLPRTLLLSLEPSLS